MGTRPQCDSTTASGDYETENLRGLLRTEPPADWRRRRGGGFAPWFAAIARRLLNACDFIVRGERYRFAELEMYYYGAAHPDRFSHRDPLQLEAGRWYFHRSRGEYRGGSFKGLDLTLGDGQAYFGILIRTVVSENNRVLDGPCVTVDHLLAETKTAAVAALDGMIAARSIWDTSSPLHIAEAAKPRTAIVYQTCAWDYR